MKRVRRGTKGSEVSSVSTNSSSSIYNTKVFAPSPVREKRRPSASPPVVHLQPPTEFVRSSTREDLINEAEAAEAAEAAAEETTTDNRASTTSTAGYITNASLANKVQTPKY